MSNKSEGAGKIPEKFDDNVVLFLCRGPDRKKVRFRKRNAVPRFKQEVGKKEKVCSDFILRETSSSSAGASKGIEINRDFLI